MLHRGLDVLVKEAGGHHLAGTGEPLGAKVVIVGVGQLQERVADKVFRRCKISNHDGSDFLERGAGQRLGPRKAKVDVVVELKGGADGRQEVELLGDVVRSFGEQLL